MDVAKALTIAGSDSGGGAGIQADLKTFQELDVFGTSALTAVTAQNTLGVQGVYPLSVDAVKEQIQSVGTDIAPGALKTGMLFSSEIIRTVSDMIQEFQWEKLVVDPVMIAKGGSALLQKEAIKCLKKNLIPLAYCITPNLPEAEEIVGFSITNREQQELAAQSIYKMGAKHVVIKGGHGDGEQATDLLYDGEDFHFFTASRIQTKHTHGTGCTYSAAITAELAKGRPIYDAVSTAKSFIQDAIENQLGIGAGHGPTNHWAYQKRKANQQISF
ncbi:bifunctional hydroxymethylpyrimidine kinase/phosphomethylpyrimidine kinase [Salinibacillus xinjiangensis]|uniref:Hydroxymethylpyrimidine/phosphomethylpyrimidine kinase n=1 Tax=Salinibacillus xinjiangensis TaxID=1229268 RepID=A0A6G1X5R0_9BACI|nr:bifunctional hydroxymethylpyrimidine kinase/phosphomethylpyrimidine kinase [Salinibacillus xinjiangensis]MRG86158.1 bifunctional hydroxymethylpyrimidine kinase/phosphomethylpyrimidine kinase [Salinibacillus xinjiangensis]